MYAATGGPDTCSENYSGPVCRHVLCSYLVWLDEIDGFWIFKAFSHLEEFYYPSHHFIQFIPLILTPLVSTGMTRASGESCAERIPIREGNFPMPCAAIECIVTSGLVSQISLWTFDAFLSIFSYKSQSGISFLQQHMRNLCLLHSLPFSLRLAIFGLIKGFCLLRPASMEGAFPVLDGVSLHRFQIKMHLQ